MKSYENCPVHEWNDDAAQFDPDARIWDTVVPAGINPMNENKAQATAGVTGGGSPGSSIVLPPNHPNPTIN